MALSAGDVSQVTFNTAPFGMRGYDMHEVDEFLARVETAMAEGVEGRRPSLSPVDVREVSFSPGSRLRRGYSVEEVDGFLDQVEAELDRYQRQAVSGGQPREPQVAPPLEEQQKRPWWRRG